MWTSKLSKVSVLVVILTGWSVPVAMGQCAHGDLDGSGTVDLADHDAFVECLTGPDGGPIAPGCGPVDFDGDDDVDLQDFGVFEHVFGLPVAVPFDKHEFGAGYGPQSLAIGDLNGDGHLDLAVANFDSDTVSVLLNQGDGTFADDVLYGARDKPISVTIGDLDGDGDLDLAVANRGDYPDYIKGVSVLLNHGDGTFADDVLYGAGITSYSVAIGDLDGDGDLDLAVGDSGVHVWLNQGDGTFPDDVHYGAGGGPSSVAIGDLDGDGDLDLAVANETGGNVSVLLNQGDGTFADDVLYGAAGKPASVVIGDLDGDGDLDLAVANRGINPDYIASVSVLLNQGDGTFADDVLYAAPSWLRPFAIGDLDGDGDLDLVVANEHGENVSLLLNRGDGTFADEVLYGVGDGPRSVAIGDLDGDGDLDLATANYYGDNVSVLLNQCVP